jgi:hypothetical protein
MEDAAVDAAKLRYAVNISSQNMKGLPHAQNSLHTIQKAVSGRQQDIAFSENMTDIRNFLLNALD